jgi:acetyl esterase/lipase
MALVRPAVRRARREGMAVMSGVDVRLRAWGWLTRRMMSVTSMTDDQVIAVQQRTVPANPVTGWLFGTAPAGVTVTSRTAPGAAGDIPVRVYQPAGAARHGAPGRPLVLYFHGGGFALGPLAMGDWICGTVAARVGAVVVSVGYRLAPGHRFPAAVEDCYAALRWAAGDGAALGAAGLVGVMGESAGGNLAAVTCLLARDRGGPAIAHQALIYPATDMTREPAPGTDPNAPFLSAAESSAYKRLYLGPDGDPADPWASPLLAAGHAGLPPALIQVGEHDPLRGDGVAYAAALRAAGVPVRFTEYLGMPHGFVNFPGLSRAAHQALSEVCAEQAAYLTPPVP